MSRLDSPKPEDFFKQKEIGGNRYTIVALGAIAAYKGATILSKTIAPVFGEVLDSRNVDEDAMMFEKQNTWREVLTIITDNINTPEVDELVFKMLEGVTCNGERIDLDEHFKGKVHELVELIMYALEVNFKGFFTGNGIFQSIMGGLGKVMKGTEVE